MVRMGKGVDSLMNVTLVEAVTVTGTMDLLVNLLCHKVQLHKWPGQHQLCHLECCCCYYCYC